MKKKGLIISLSLLLAAIIVLFGVLIIKNRDQSQKGDKTITVTVVYEDKTEKKFKINTDADNLGDALYEEKLVTEEEHKSGYYTQIDGIRAHYEFDRAWWCFSQEGETATAGANDLPIKDGDQFEITYTPS